jgi:predicted Zn-dependent protease
MNDLQQRIPDAQATSVDEAQVKSFLSRANELIDQNLLVAAQDVVEEGLSALGENAELLDRLADICLWKDHREEALAHMARALKISPNDPSIVSDYIDMLAALNLEREAINYSNELPPDVRADVIVRLALGHIYANAGWHALATDTYGETKEYIFHFKGRVWRSWWRSGGPVPQIRRFVRNTITTPDAYGTCTRKIW